MITKEERALVTVCIREVGTRVEPADLWQEGYVGLLKARKDFDPERGFKFSTYAKPRIKGAIRDYLRLIDPLTRGQRAAAKAGKWACPETQHYDGIEDSPATYVTTPHAGFAAVDAKDEVESILAAGTPREAAFLRGMLAGRTQQQIAVSMHIPYGTGLHILAGIRRKLAG